MIRILRIFSHMYLARLGKDLSMPYLQIIMQNLGSLCFFFFHLLAFSFITDRFTFSNWNRDQMYVLFYSFQIYTYLAFYFFWKGFIQTVNFIHNGQFDLIMTKPLSGWILSFFQGGGLHNLFAAAIGAIFLFVHLTSSGISITFLSLILYLLSMIFSLLFLLSFSSIFISLNFYGSRLNVFGIGFTFQELMKYPAQLYPAQNSIFYLLIIPFALLVTVPASLLIGKPVSPNLLVIYFVSIILTFIVSQIVWRHSLHHYSSAN